MKDLNENRAAIYAAMADEDAGEVPVSRANESSSSSYTLEHNGTKVELATLEYVRRLEQTIQAQARVIKQMERQFARTAAALRNHRQTNNRLTYAVGDLSRDLDYKIDRRD